MIYFPLSKGYISRELPVAAGFEFAAEGQAAIQATSGQVFGARPSAGGAGEVFLGVAVSRQITITSKARAERFVVPVGLEVQLDRTPQGGTTAVYNVTTSAVIASGGGGWSLAGRTLTLPAGTAGQTIEVYYKYAVTAKESRALQGDIYPGGAAGFVVNQIGVIKNGPVFTDQFDTTVNWNAANPIVTLGANGQFTIGGSGVAVNCAVIQVPTSESAFLGLDLNY